MAAGSQRLQVCAILAEQRVDAGPWALSEALSAREQPQAPGCGALPEPEVCPLFRVGSAHSPKLGRTLYLDSALLPPAWYF